MKNCLNQLKVIPTEKVVKFYSYPNSPYGLANQEFEAKNPNSSASYIDALPARENVLIAKSYLESNSQRFD